MPFATINVLIASSRISSIIIQVHGRITVTPPKEGELLLIARYPVPIWTKDNALNSKVPPSPSIQFERHKLLPEDWSAGIITTSNNSTPIEPVHNTLSVT